MTVGDLEGLLARYPKHFKVILQKDAEGNGFSPLSQAGAVIYVPREMWYGDVVATEDELPMEQMNAIVLVPVN